MLKKKNKFYYFLLAVTRERKYNKFVIKIIITYFFIPVKENNLWKI